MSETRSSHSGMEVDKEKNADTLMDSIKTHFNPPTTKANIVISTKAKLDNSVMRKALTWQGKSKVKLVDYPKPMVTDPGDAIIRVTTNTVCGSDLHLFFNEVPGFDVMHKDDIMGHEAVGIVESVGPDVKNLKVGQRVTIAFPIACGNCQFCREQKFTCCDQTNPSSEQELVQGQRLSAMFGYSAMTGGLSGCQSEYVRVPIADLNCLPLPDTVSDDKAIMLSDILVTAFHATEVCHVSKGDSVVVMGAGPVGQLCAMWAKQRGASYVLLVDQHQARLDVAKRALGIDTLNFKEFSSVRKEILKRLPQGVDVGIDAAAFRYAKGLLHKIERAVMLETDTSEVLDELIYVAKKCGRISIIADYFGKCNGFPIGPLMEKGITLYGAGQCPVQRYWKDMLKMLENKQVDPSFIISHEIPFEQMEEAYKVFGTEQNDCLKMVIRTKAYREVAHLSPNVTGRITSLV